VPERIVRANGIEIWCEDFGSPASPALLLVMGASAQGILWPEDFCGELASAGLHVIRYDNRDTGMSTCFDFAAAPYTLSDMARDAVGVLDAFGVARAHVAGASMGGMIGQTLALEYPARVRTLTTIMSTPFGASVQQSMAPGASGELAAHPRLLAAMAAQLAKPPRTHDERIESAVALWRALAGSGEPFDEAEVRRREARVLARARNIDASQNHGLAIARSPDRLEALRGLRIPTLVFHGDDDPILPLAHGRLTAEAIPGARFVVIPGMGHDLPPKARARLAQELLAHVRAHAA
jgi:pimeloyl-ACP methyl ester carboxylesterase